ncbi:20768_t:CDS:1, partial [Gigaspora rosea]
DFDQGQIMRITTTTSNNSLIKSANAISRQVDPSSSSSQFDEALQKVCLSAHGASLSTSSLVNKLSNPNYQELLPNISEELAHYTVQTIANVFASIKSMLKDLVEKKETNPKMQIALVSGGSLAGYAAALKLRNCRFL